MGESEMGIGICPKKRLWFKKQKRRIENIQIWSFKNQKEYIYIYIKYGKIYQQNRL